VTAAPVANETKRILEDLGANVENVTWEK